MAKPATEQKCIRGIPGSGEILAMKVPSPGPAQKASGGEFDALYQVSHEAGLKPDRPRPKTTQLPKEFSWSQSSGTKETARGLLRRP